MTAIIDYQMGNLASLANSLAKIGAKAKVARTSDDLKGCDRLILPGVGAFGDAAAHLRSSGMDEAIKSFAHGGGYVLGVCLGLQILFSSSEESPDAIGLGLLEGKVTRFDAAKAAHKIKIPHMGWNELRFERSSKLFAGVADRSRLYFVHSYHILLPNALATTFYGYEFASAIEQENIFAIQPHPEKSHETGLKILSNFVKMR
ncbi:imidazole glycerol phosphate synthase subunit HisH [Campylobacterota bacterium]|nr:imidazole glycerol phosphate synthase subunit HisH [Campylobacterota bacterium]